MQKQEGAIEEEIFENERYLPIRGWGSRGGLLPTERRRYSTRDGSQSFNDFPTLHLPNGEMLQRSASTCGAPWHPACVSHQRKTSASRRTRWRAAIWLARVRLLQASSQELESVTFGFLHASFQGRHGPALYMAIS